jgi:predicted nucleic acid-binding protein
MADVAVDTNILVKWVIQEPDSPQADTVAADVTASGDALIALDLALVEAANVLCTLVNRGLLPAPEATRLFGLLASRPLRIVSARPLLPQAIDIATRYRLAIYDALFIALTADLRYRR